MGAKIAAPDRDPFAFMFAIEDYRTSTNFLRKRKEKTAPVT